MIQHEEFKALQSFEGRLVSIVTTNAEGTKFIAPPGRISGIDLHPGESGSPIDDFASFIYTKEAGLRKEKELWAGIKNITPLYNFILCDFGMDTRLDTRSLAIIPTRKVG